MINNVVLISGIQQSDSVIHIHVSILFQILFPFRLLHNIGEFGIDMYALLYLKWITNKDLLYSTGNSIQYYRSHFSFATVEDISSQAVFLLSS